MKIIFLMDIIMRLFILALLIIITACSEKEQTNLFKDFEQKEDVVIILSAYHLDSIPQDIGFLVNAKSLTISIDSIKDGWTVYPPLSALDDIINRPPFRKLPHEITNLTRLKKLSMQGLSISELPEDFERLENLEYLDLSFNKLTISKELPKLKKLKKLKQIGIFWNKIDKAEIEVWKKEAPGLEIYYGIEQ